ncbi:MAG: phosphoribosyltransferase [Clostridia bacterium]|nr:phosphoribosyltransferase [Clostridia bacterium]
MDKELMVLNVDDVKKMSIQLAQSVKETPDLVAFVAKGAYLIGQTVAEYFDVPLIEIEAVRSGNQLKDLVRPLLTILPGSVKVWLRKKEMNAGTHAQNRERHVAINDPNKILGRDFHTILLVDDAVDTGNTILAVAETLQKALPQAHIITAAFFVFEASKELVHMDYNLYGDTIFSAPWSNDSSYHKGFMAQYKQMKAKGVF